MNTLVRFFDKGVCLIRIYLYYDTNYVLKDVINWLESHDIGPILFIIAAFRLYLRNKYKSYMYLQDSTYTSKNKDLPHKYEDRPVDYVIDIGKYMDNLLVKLKYLEKKVEAVDTPKNLRYRFNL